MKAADIVAGIFVLTGAVCFIALIVLFVLIYVL